MASVIKAGNATDGVQVTSDNTGILELKTGTGSGTTAMTVGTGQAVTFAQAANLPNTFGFKNRIINGAMVIDQRNAGASVTGGAASYTFPVDRFKFYTSAASKLSGQRSTTAPAGFINSLLLTSLAATTPAAGDEYQLYHAVEGLNTADFGWGTANAATVTLSFWVQSSLTGTFAGALANNGGTRSYIFTYTISAANTWEYKTVTIAGDTSGTWNTSTAAGVYVIWDLGSGTNLNGTAGAWAGAFDTRTSGSVSVIGTNGATFYITGVQLEKGSTATSFDYRPYGTELALCQRYYTQLKFGCTGVFGSSSSGNFSTQFPVQMRAAPTYGQTGVIVADNFYSVTSTQSSTNITLLSADVTGGTFRMANFSGFTAGQPSQLAPSNANYVTVSAEL